MAGDAAGAAAERKQSAEERGESEVAAVRAESSFENKILDGQKRALKLQQQIGQC